MINKVLLSTVAVVALHAGAIDEAFSEGKVNGQIRAAYIQNDYDAGGDDYAGAIGGILKYETKTLNNLTLGIAAYVSQDLRFISGDDEHKSPDFFNDERKSYVYLGEAYADYTTDVWNVRIGRQQIDTPFADTDDIRMHPNTFEAAMATYKGFEHTTVLGGYLSRMAGYDSGDDISSFKRLDGDDSHGAAVIGVMNDSIEKLGVQGWYYSVDNIADMVYADATYLIPFSDDAGLELSAQFARFNEKSGSGIDGNVYGLAASLNAGALTLGAAYNGGNNDTGKAPTVGFGGGPYFTSMEEWTIEGMNDAKACQLSAELDLADAGLEGVALALLYGDFKSDTDNTKVREWDFVASFEWNEVISGDISYATIDDKHNNADGGSDAGYDRFLVRVNYNF